MYYSWQLLRSAQSHVQNMQIMANSCHQEANVILLLCAESSRLHLSSSNLVFSGVYQPMKITTQQQLIMSRHQTTIFHCSINQKIIMVQQDTMTVIDWECSRRYAPAAPLWHPHQHGYHDGQPMQHDGWQHHRSPAPRQPPPPRRGMAAMRGTGSAP